MDRLIKQSWWKVLSVLILLYVFVVGLLVPLKPNVTTVNPSTAMAGERLTLRMNGYNTSFTSDTENLRAWLRLDADHVLVAEEISAISDQTAEAVFSLPALLPSVDSVVVFSLIVDGPIDGAFVRPGALFVTQPRIDSIAAAAAWPAGRMEELHEREGMTFPFRNILAETIRNTYFHVSLWLAMMLIFIAAVVYAVKYLRRQSKSSEFEGLDVIISARERMDYWSHALTLVGLLFGVLGLVTGALWARYTWGSWWNWDIKQFTTLIALLIYTGYFVLRSAFPDEEARARVSAVYNIFAFAALIPLIYVLPRLSDSSLHPGNGGNPALGGEDLDNTMRMVFYPAVIGWTLFGGWMASLFYRLRRVEAVERYRQFPPDKS